MVYYEDTHIVIRNMEFEDAVTIHTENLSQGWHSQIQVYEKYYHEQEQNVRDVLVAMYDGKFAGYTTLRLQATAGPFANRGIPEISDFNVFVQYRRKGIGNKILDVAERAALRLNKIVSLGVGLHSGYGTAQRMYVKRGYVPDGSGVWYRDCLLAPYSDCCNDDDLVLYFSKQL